MFDPGGESVKKIPVILDTDIGQDIDDTWALALLLKSTGLEAKLIVTDTGDTTYRARLAAKMLEIAGRTDVPVGVGLHRGACPMPQGTWVEDYDLARYPGTVYPDGVGTLVDTIMQSPDPVTLICIGPVPNVAEALRRDPGIAGRARFVGMHGCLHRSHDGSDKVIAEYNVAQDVQAAQKVFTADWEMMITPLDTCGLVRLRGEKYQAVRTCDDPLVQAVIENYHIWAGACGRSDLFERGTSILFDTVAVYLAFSQELLVMEDHGIRVTDDGFTVIDESAKRIRCAMEWKDLPAFEDFLVSRLTGGSG